MGPLSCASDIPRLATARRIKYENQISSWYLHPVRFPCTKIVGVLGCMEIPSHTMIDPLPNTVHAFTFIRRWLAHLRRDCLCLHVSLSTLVARASVLPYGDDNELSGVPQTDCVVRCACKSIMQMCNTDLHILLTNGLASLRLAMPFIPTNSLLKCLGT